MKAGTSLSSRAMKPFTSGKWYRSASPIDDEYNRAGYAGKLAEQAGVRFILDLSDNAEELAEFEAEAAKKGTDVSFFKSLMDADAVAAIDLSSNYMGDSYKEKLVGGLVATSQHEGPYLFHCVEGKDRTGFVALLLEGLAEASYDEIRADYMKTCENYYGITEQNDPAKYQAIVDLKLNDMPLAASSASRRGVTGSPLQKTTASTCSF